MPATFPASSLSPAEAKELREECGLPFVPPEPIPDDPWRFVCDCVFTWDEHRARQGLDAIRPLAGDGDEYLEYLTRQWQRGGRQQWKKSRQIRVTWLLAALHLWEALHLSGIRTGYQAKKFEDADSFLHERFWFIYEHIPAKYAKPKARYISGVIEVYHDINTSIPTSQIMALAEGPDQVRQYTYSRLWRDEAAFHNDQKAAHGAAQPTLDGGGADLKTSSSGGNATFFYDLAEKDVAPGPVEAKHEVAKGITAWKRNGYDHLFIHYSADPKKRPGTPEGSAWIASAKEGQPTDLWEREMEGNDEVQVNRPVFCDTDRIVAEKQVYRPWLRVFGGLDFGYGTPACVLFQVEPIEETKEKIVHCFKEFTGKDIDIANFYERVIRAWLMKYLPGHKTEDIEWYGDPAGNQKESTSGKSDIEVLSSLGVTVMSKAARVETTKLDEAVGRINILQAIISAGHLHVDPETCPELLNDLRGGYSRDEFGKILKDGVHDHRPDALGYPIYNLFGFDTAINYGTPTVHPGTEMPTAQPSVKALTKALPFRSNAPVTVERQTARVYVPARFDWKDPRNARRR